MVSLAEELGRSLTKVVAAVWQQGEIDKAAVRHLLLAVAGQLGEKKSQRLERLIEIQYPHNTMFITKAFTICPTIVPYTPQLRIAQMPIVNMLMMANKLAIKIGRESCAALKIDC
ncbi:unnamed protein product, partial [marine sediment metagenome]